MMFVGEWTDSMPSEEPMESNATNQSGEPRAIIEQPVKSEMMFMTAEASRFPAMPTVTMLRGQEERKDELFASCKVPSFEPRNEQQFEDWIDEIARFVYRHKIHPKLFQELRESRASRAIATIIAKAQNEDFESMIDFVARKMFVASEYPSKLEEQLMRPLRQTSVIEAQVWVAEKLARYQQVSKRREWNSPLGDDRVRECLLRGLPRDVESSVRDRQPKTCDDILRIASFRECRMRGANPEFVMAADEDEAHNAKKSRTEETTIDIS
eukprot:GHVQ01009172.1.p1 GENE.GHVQ01009172.1~~GHVQ01009172.1.p1  ORF type:complete len:268 (-),score=39.91 GHVQ01009172.1:622-1425(-)